MEVSKEKAALLSNYEVLKFLEELGQTRRDESNTAHVQRMQNLATITYESTRYLQGTACAHQSEQIIKDFLKKIEPFKLTKAEKLQLLNTRPTTQVEIQLIVESVEERLSEEQIDSLIEICMTMLPVAEIADEAAEYA